MVSLTSILPLILWTTSSSTLFWWDRASAFSTLPATRHKNSMMSLFWNSRRFERCRISAFLSTSEEDFSSVTNIFDVVIVGGSAAGLSAALTLGRSLRNVLVVDNGSPCNSNQISSHNLLGSDGVAPPLIAKKSRDDVQKYATVRILDDATVQHIERTTPGSYFTVTIRQPPKNDNNNTTMVVTSRKLILAIGMEDVLPIHIPGLKECWGKSVLHCPYCHGYEFHSQSTALYNVSTEMLRRLAPILNTLTDELHIILGDAISSDWEESQSEDIRQIREDLQRHGIPVHTQSITKFIHSGDGFLTGLLLDNGTELPMDAVYIRPPQQLNLPTMHLSESTVNLLLDDTGCLATDFETQQTSVKGIFACGDCTTPNRALSIAVASGTKAAKMLNFELSMEDWLENSREHGRQS